MAKGHLPSPSRSRPSSTVRRLLSPNATWRPKIRCRCISISPSDAGDTPKIVDGHVQAAPGRHWLFRMRNAETKLDAEQVIREIDAFIEQLGKDIEKIETLVSISTRPSPKMSGRTRREVIARLHQLTEHSSDEFSPLTISRNVAKVQKVLPEDLPIRPGSPLPGLCRPDRTDGHLLPAYWDAGPREAGQ